MISIITFFISVQFCGAIIYELNDTEYGRMPPLFQLDDYESCMRNFKGPYCVVQTDLFADPPNELITLMKEFSEFTTSHYNHTYIEKGICVPTTCNSYIDVTEYHSFEELKMAVASCINRTIWDEYGLQAELTNIDCVEPNKTTKYDWSDWMFGGVLLFLVAVNLIGSLYDLLREREHSKDSDKNGNPYLLSFSVRLNWKYLTSMEYSDPRYECLKGLHGIRAITCFFIVIAHVLWIYACGFIDNPQDLEKASDSIHYQLIFNGMVIVQVFFVMSGFLMVYKLQIYSESLDINWSSLHQIFINRWLRLTPANALMIAFTGTWLRHLGSGPLWNISVTSVASDCRTYWWAHIIYVNNYIPEDKLCAIQSWHIAADTQVFFLGLFVYIATKSRGKIIALTLLLLLSILAPAAHVWFQDLDALVLLKPEFYRRFVNETYRRLHLLGHNNICCFVIGMAAGYKAYDWQKNKIKVLNHKIWRYLTWCVLPAIVGLLLTGQIFYVKEERHSIIVRMVYAAMHRGVFGVIIAFLILSTMLRVEGVQRGLLEWRGWVIPSRLSYMVYLLHLNIVHALIGARTQLGHIHFFNVIVDHLGIITLSFLLAVPAYLLFEAPFTALTKTIYSKDKLLAKKKN